MATHIRARAGLALLTATALALLTGCATTPGANDTAPTQEESATVVASTTWQGMFATAAGAGERHRHRPTLRAACRRVRPDPERPDQAHWS